MRTAQSHRLGRDPRLRSGWLRPVVLVLLSCLLLASCSPAYVMRAAYEEGKILWRRKPIQEILRREDLDPIRRAKFETVLGVREFAKEKLGLRVGGSYASYSHLDRPILSYLLTAVPKTKFEPYTWWFLFVGTVPYKGYFDRSDAEHEARELEENGYDTYIRPVGAFSTLGWFDDPVLEPLLRLNRVRLADVILHELLHNTLFVKGSVDFNESLANFVGKRGAVEYFTERYGPASIEARTAMRIWEEELEFSRFLMKWVACLKELYAEPIPEPEKLHRRIMLFEAMQIAWRNEISGRPERFYTGFEETKLNNAVVMQYYLYVHNLELFEKLYQRAARNLRKTIEEIEVVAESGTAPFDALAQLVDGTAGDAPHACPASLSRSGL